jgi:hypothetical protein
VAKNDRPISKSASTTIEGVVFIVTKGADNLKLGLIQVQLFSRAAFNQHRELTKANLRFELDGLKERITDAQAEAFTFTNRIAQVQGQIDCEEAGHGSGTPGLPASEAEGIGSGWRVDVGARVFRMARLSQSARGWSAGGTDGDALLQWGRAA